MKCHEVQSKIAQIDDDSPAAEIIVHARECAACHQSLREVLWQQKWLRERFAEVSEQLLAHAPPLWGAAFQERLKGPALPAPLLPVAWAAVLLGAAGLGWWTWTTSTTSSSKSSSAERHAPRESAERPTASANHRAHSKPISSPSEFESLGTASASSWPAETGPVWTLPEQSTVPHPSPELAVSQSLSKPAVSQSSTEPASAEASPAVAVGAPTLSVASTEPAVTLNFDGATGEDLEVVDTAGNVLMTVGAATKPQVVSRVNPSPTP